MATSLYGFTGNEVRPLGQIRLAISLGEEPARRTRYSFFTIVDAPSSYNVILGRPTLGAFSTVVSTYHQKIKFPSGRLSRRGARRSDVFAWTPTDLTGVSPSIAIHRLNVLPGARPIKQKRRHFGPEQNKVIREEVQKLLKAGYIKEVHFPTWLSNVVLVPKPGNKWRVCMDFRDLNKACPKDCYPLPRIDQLVDSTSGCEYICMLDAYQGYHQIPLSVDDQDKVLKRAQKFEWNEDCDKAFLELKEYLIQLPRLAKPSPGEPLWMYLSASNSVASSVLVKQEGQSQQPIYFSSHLFKDAETRYSNLEKLAWMLVLSIRKLRPYFLSHPVTVMTNSNLGRLLTQPKISGWLVKWTVELGEYDIQYQPRTAIKAQALADFLTEIPEGEAEQIWKVYVDGSSNRQGSGIGVVLISPQEEEIRLSIRLSFRASNNEAEYEVVLVGLQAAKRMGAARVHLHSDSQLVAQQVEGNYEVRNDRLRRYAEAFTKLKGKIQRGLSPEDSSDREC
ncbi:uncharacterized protein LOC141843477 [Curcuma longa]|uniref:uncharacterized protein LOC141843477 n=1 Tax=Curcuma longa TaxID=136217 RepID=UPI003D9F90EB